MATVFFDLDQTLLNGDSDFAWGEFLAERGCVDNRVWRAENRRFFDLYSAGELDMDEWLRFALSVLRDNPRERLEQLREGFVEERIVPMRNRKVGAVLAGHLGNGDLTAIITATNRFVAEPIAALMGVEHLIATEPEMRDGEFTGECAGTPCFREGKVERAADWLHRRGLGWEETVFYSDSHNDLPLLERVSAAVAVNPDPRLSRRARRRAGGSSVGCERLLGLRQLVAEAVCAASLKRFGVRLGHG